MTQQQQTVNQTQAVTNEEINETKEALINLQREMRLAVEKGNEETSSLLGTLGKVATVAAIGAAAYFGIRYFRNSGSSTDGEVVGKVAEAAFKYFK